MSELDETRENLANYAHEAWSGWMKYLFSKSETTFSGAVIIPKWAVERWRRQMTTSYKDLPENEKNSDREEADKMISIADLVALRAELDRQISINKTIAADVQKGTHDGYEIVVSTLRAENKRLVAQLASAWHVITDYSIYHSDNYEETPEQKRGLKWLRKYEADSSALKEGEE